MPISVYIFMSIDLFCILKYHRKQSTNRYKYYKMQSDGRNKYDKLHGSVLSE